MKPIFVFFAHMWLRLKMAWEIMKMARREYLARTGQLKPESITGIGPGTMIRSSFPSEVLEASRRARTKMLGGMARVAWTALVLFDEETTEWDELTDEMRGEHTKRVERVLSLPNYLEMLHAMLKAGTLNQKEHDVLAIFALMVMSCAEGLHENGICVCPLKDATAPIATEENEERDLFPTGTMQ